MSAERLAALIRQVDGAHNLGAAELAERLIERGVALPLGYVQGDQVLIVGTEYAGQIGTVRGRSLPSAPSPGVWVSLSSVARPLLFSGLQIRLLAQQRPAPASAEAWHGPSGSRCGSGHAGLSRILMMEEPAMTDMKCSLEMVQEWQDRITEAKTTFGPGSDEHCKTVAWAEAQGPALVADYLTLSDQLQQERKAWERLKTAAADVMALAGPDNYLAGPHWTVRPSEIATVRFAALEAALQPLAAPHAEAGEGA